MGRNRMTLGSNKYNPEGRTVRSADEIHEGLVNHPDNANCREEKDLLCSWRRSYERHMNESGSAAWRAFQKKIDGEQSQGVRALTLLAEREGMVDTVYHAHSDGFLSWKWRLASIPPEDRIDLLAAYKKKQENEIRLPGLEEKISPEEKYSTLNLSRVFIMGSKIVFAQKDPFEEMLNGNLPETQPALPAPKLY